MNNICERFRECLAEYGKDALNGAILLTPNDNDRDYYSDIRTLYSATIAEYKLANVRFKVARFFEEIDK